MKHELGRLPAVLFFVIGVTTVQSNARATVIYTSQNRSVSATLTPPGSSSSQDVDSTTALGQWSGDAAVAGDGLARATQNSNINSLKIDMSGGLRATINAGAAANAASELQVNFALDVPTPFSYVAITALDLNGTITQVGTGTLYSISTGSSMVNGILPAGDFAMHLIYNLDVGPPATNTLRAYQFDFFFLPEPGTSTLALAAAVILASVSRRC